MIKKGGIMHSTRSMLWYLIILLIICGTLLVVIMLVPRHSSPEYNVQNYETLSRLTEGKCILPDKTVLSGERCHFVVYLRSRFSNSVVGYLIGCDLNEEYAKGFSLDCKSIAVLPEEARSIKPTMEYQSIGLAVDYHHLSFVMDNYRYDVHGTETTDGFQQFAILIAQSIIDQRP